MAADGRIKPMIDLFEKNNVQEAVDKTANGEVGLRAVAKYDEERSSIKIIKCVSPISQPTTEGFYSSLVIYPQNDRKFLETSHKCEMSWEG
jgi:hypothetical protein